MSGDTFEALQVYATYGCWPSRWKIGVWNWDSELRFDIDKNYSTKDKWQMGFQQFDYVLFYHTLLLKEVRVPLRNGIL